MRTSFFFLGLCAFVFGLSWQAYASSQIQMLPPVENTTTGLGCNTSAGHKILTWDGATTIKCNRDVTVSTAGALGLGMTNPRGRLDAAGDVYFGARNTSTATVHVGAGATGNRTSRVFLVSDTTYPTYGLGINRAAGANATSSIIHRGTGALVLSANEAGSIGLNTSNARRVTVTSAGDVGIGTTAPTTKLHVAGGVKVGNETAACNASRAGAIRWTGSKFMGCTGSVWTDFITAATAKVAVDYSTCTPAHRDHGVGLVSYFNKWGASGSHNINLACTSKDYVVVAMDHNTVSDAYCCKLKLE